METLSQRVSRALALNRTLAVVLLSVLLFGLGEQLWSPFLPAYLDAQGRGAADEAAQTGVVAPSTLWLVGLYVLARNLFESACYVGGGRLTAALGDRGSLLAFGALTLVGYALFLVVDAPTAAVLAALMIMAWEPLSLPVTFTTVGATVDSSRRGLAFAIQSIQKRLPKILGPAAAGGVFASMEAVHGPDAGRVVGMRWLVGAAMALGVATLFAQWRFMPKRPPDDDVGGSWTDVWSGLPPLVRRLLLAEVFTRWCDWLVREFVVLYVLFVRGRPIAEVGFLMTLQHTTALVTYLPIGQLTQRTGLRPFVGLTFVFFALFPVSLALVPDGWLWLAFVVYGLREIGEPARKALITTNVPKAIRARGVGLYWGLRTALVSWAGLAGAAMWLAWGPTPLLVAAFALGVVGALTYVFLCLPEPRTPEPHAPEPRP